MSSWYPTEGLYSWLTGSSTGVDAQPEPPKNEKPKRKKKKSSKAKATEESDEHKRRLLEDQRQRELEAIDNNRFVNNQAAVYLHKASGTKYDARIVDVHYDDGPDNPYYTIKYVTSDGETIERQTTWDRLTPVEWDEGRAWRYISSSNKPLAAM